MQLYTDYMAYSGLIWRKINIKLCLLVGPRLLKHISWDKYLFHPKVLFFDFVVKKTEKSSGRSIIFLIKLSESENLLTSDILFHINLFWL